MSNDSLGDRMKGYEDLYRIKLMKRCPKIIRIDGKAFHTFLKNAEKPFEQNVMTAMAVSAQAVMREIGGISRLAYIQSDECSIAINDALTLDTSAWFDNNLQKMVSVASSIFTETFNNTYIRCILDNKKAHFDARAFCLPDLNEMKNYFVWRQQDATRNSIRMYAATMFSHNELHGVSNDKAQEMMFQKNGFNWNDADAWTKRGMVVTKDTDCFDWNIPIFTSNRDYLEELYNPREAPNDPEANR